MDRAPFPIRPAKSLILLASLVPLLATLPSCFEDIDAKGCRTLADCPPGYTSCEDGFCFNREPGCAGAKPVPGDDCCPTGEGDRADDVDCLVADIALGPADPDPLDPEDDWVVTELSCPAVADDGAVVVAAVVRDGTDTSRVMAFRTDAAMRNVVARARAGDGWVARPAVIGHDFSAYVAHAGGVARMSTAALELEAEVASGLPAGGIVAVGGDESGAHVVVWATESGKVVVYDEKDRTRIELTLKPEYGGGEAWAPVASGSGRRAYVVWKSGIVLAIRTRDTPVGPTAVGCADGAWTPGRAGGASACSGEKPSGPPVEWGRRLYVPLGPSGRVVALEEEEPQSIARRWAAPLDLGGPIAGRLLVDARGRLVAVLRSGGVRVVKDQGQFGSIVEMADFGTPVADVPPLLGADDRVAVFGEGGGEVLSILRREGTTGAAFEPGIRFRLPVPAAGAPALADGVLVHGTSGGRLAAWTFPDELAAAGFPKDGADAGNSGRSIQIAP